MRHRCESPEDVVIDAGLDCPATSVSGLASNNTTVTSHPALFRAFVAIRASAVRKPTNRVLGIAPVPYLISVKV